MKTKDFINLLKKSLELDPSPEAYMYIPEQSPSGTVATMEELFQLDKEWERAKEAGEYFNIDVDINNPGFIFIYPKRYPELLAMPPSGKKIYPKDQSLRMIFGFIHKVQSKLIEKEEKEKFA